MRQWLSKRKPFVIWLALLTSNLVVGIVAVWTGSKTWILAFNCYGLLLMLATLIHIRLLNRAERKLLEEQAQNHK